MKNIGKVVAKDSEWPWLRIEQSVKNGSKIVQLLSQVNNTPMDRSNFRD